MGQKTKYEYSSDEVLAYAKTQKSLISRGLLNPSAFQLPQFFCIGAQKAGTTWLYYNLKKHPQFRFRAKEIHYFDIKRNFDKPLEYYSQYFDFKNKRTICGDITPSYSLLSEDRLKFIQKLVPDAKFVMLLRNPVERVWSAALMQFVKHRNEDMSQVSVEELMPFISKKEVLERGYYIGIIEKFQKFWPAENFYIGFYDQISSEPKKLFTEIITHLGAKPELGFDDSSLTEVVHKRKQEVEIFPEIKEFLDEHYKEHIVEMKKKWGAAVSNW